jgi:DNA (cytosine-5)-methyltransferase 1
LAVRRAEFDVQGRVGVAPHRGPALRLPPHPASPDPADLAAVRRWVRSAPRPTAIDLFSGAGGLSLGLQQAGFTVLVGADVDTTAVETHRANIPGIAYEGDLSDPSDLLDHLVAWGITKVDVIAGGVPCQPFSRAGRSKIRSLVEAGHRGADDPRAQMWQSFIAVVERLRPRAVMLENVPDLAAWDEGAVLIGFCESLRELGYRTDAAILKAHDYGVPQHRSRLFIIGMAAGGVFAWPKQRWVRPSVRSAIGDLPAAPPAQRDDRVPYSGKPLTPFQRRMRTGLAPSDRNFLFDHITRDVRADDAEAFALLKEGDTYESLPPRLQRYRADIFSDKYKRLEWDGLSRSITAHIAKDGYWYIHPSQDRTLSVREAARIQTFPDWFRFAGTPTLRFRQIGNAVPPVLAEAIGRELIGALESSTKRRVALRERTHFREDLLDWHRGNARRFPWRRAGTAPWLVLMAEMCLHRTRAEQAARVYERLCELAPSPAAMVAHREQALAVMYSLGLRWRAENVIAVAETLCTHFDGRVPDHEVELRRLPGVGDYVAQSLLSFAFGRRAVILDTNTERIVGRVHGHSRRAGGWQMRLDLHQLAGREGPDAAFNYALLDLGALVCKAGKPHCDGCPVAGHCIAGQNGARTARG